MRNRYVLNGNTLRIIMTGAITALAVAAPVTVAKSTSSSGVAVCNQATHNSVGGGLNATDGDRGSAAKYQTNLKPKSGHGKGLVNAAANSPSLTLCSAPITETPPTGGGGDDGGYDDTAAS
jgi:hypothetical protein